ARLLGMPPVPPAWSGPKPRPPPAGPRAAAAFRWIVKVMPSALGLVSWKSHWVAKRPTPTRVLAEALPAWMVGPLVTRTAQPTTAADPLSVSRPAELAKPAAKSRPIGMMSMKLILLFLAPEALRTVSRPSLTVTSTQPSAQRWLVVGVALMAS